MIKLRKVSQNIIKYVSLCIVLCCSLFFVACKKEKDPVDSNKIASISLSEEFVTREFYKNDFVDFSKYDITINYTKSASVVLKMNDVNVKIDNFSTENVGTHKATISYGETNVFFYYAILDVELVGINYNGSPITIYSQEDFDFSKVSLDLVYSNGSHRNISMNMVSISGLSKTCSTSVRNLTASYMGFNTNVGYTVTNRKIEETKMYKFEDKSGLFDSSLKYVMKSGESFIFYQNTDGEVGLQTNMTASSFNTYECSKFADRELKTFVLTLVNDTIICIEKAL